MYARISLGSHSFFNNIKKEVVDMIAEKVVLMLLFISLIIFALFYISAKTPVESS